MRAPLAPMGCPRAIAAAVHIDLIPIPALVCQGVAVRQHLRSESFVELDQVDLASLQPTFSSRRGMARAGAMNRYLGSTAAWA